MKFIYRRRAPSCVFIVTTFKIDKVTYNIGFLNYQTAIVKNRHQTESAAWGGYNK